MITKFKLFEGEINYAKEKCWKIKDKFPIPVKVEQGWTKRYYVIKVGPMLMSYETALELGDNLKLDDDTWDYRFRVMPEADNEKLKRLQNDVSMGSYDYENGEVTFTASTKKDVDNWLELYKDKVIEIK